MISKIDIKDYEKAMQEGKYEDVYKDIVEKSMELVKEIGKIKNFEFPEDEEGTELYYSIKFYFDKNFGQFSSMCNLMENLSNWYCQDDYIADTKEKKIEYCINPYNVLVNELVRYNNTKKEIDEKGYEKVLEERKEKLLNIFMEMLEYKNKQYDKNWDITKFIDKISQYYNYYSDNLIELKDAILGYSIEFDIEKDSVEINNVERIMLIDENYNEFVPRSDEDGGYKDFAYCYRDFELEDGQTYSDLYDLEEEKLIALFKEMLEFVGEETSEDEKYLRDLIDRVIEKYPFYGWRLSHLISHNPYETYIQELDRMENLYEDLSKDYKNYEENMKEYEKNKMENDEEEDEDLFDLE